MKKSAQVFQSLFPWLMLIAVLVIITIFYFFVIKDKGVGALEYLRDLFRFG